MTVPDQMLSELERLRAENKALRQARDAAERERDAAHQREAATAEALQTISRTAFDLQAVLDTLCAKAAGLLDTAWAVLFQREGDRLQQRVLHFRRSGDWYRP